MGNWRSVQIIGSCDAQHVEALRAACLCKGGNYDHFHALSFSESPSICGINDWVGTKINAAGNLAERNYSIESVAEALRGLVAVAPSLKLKVHCGGDYEDKVCVGTITVEAGNVTVGPPEVPAVAEMTDDQMESNFLRAVHRK